MHQTWEQEIEAFLLNGKLTCFQTHYKSLKLVFFFILDPNSGTDEIIITFVYIEIKMKKKNIRDLNENLKKFRNLFFFFLVSKINE